ncbi:MAG: TetR/AcrR family transcriptional regulator [Deinococcus sp.]|nr:TetR/AcrR family transcriptional regulator [Deinococcus sp.]
MTKVDRQEQETQRRRRIARAAFELFARSGLDAISAADIAQAAYVSRTNLYRYYPSKLHMLLAHFEETVEETRQAALRRLAEGKSPQAIWQGMTARMADLGVRYHHLVGAVASAALAGRGGTGPADEEDQEGAAKETGWPAPVGGPSQKVPSPPQLRPPQTSLSELVMPVLLSMQRRGDLREGTDLRVLSDLLVDSCLLALLQGQHRTPEEVQRDWQDRLELLLYGALREGQQLVWVRPGQAASADG